MPATRRGRSARRWPYRRAVVGESAFPAPLPQAAMCSTWNMWRTGHPRARFPDTSTADHTSTADRASTPTHTSNAPAGRSPHRPMSALSQYQAIRTRCLGPSPDQRTLLRPRPRPSNPQRQHVEVPHSPSTTLRSSPALRISFLITPHAPHYYSCAPLLLMAPWLLPGATPHYSCAPWLLPGATPPAHPARADFGHALHQGSLTTSAPHSCDTPHHTEAPLLVRLTTGIPHSWCLTPQAYATAATPQGKAGASLARPTPGMPHHGHPPPRRPTRASLALLPHAACTPASSHGKPGHSARLPTLQAPNGNRQPTSAPEHRSTTRPVFPLRTLPPLAPRLAPAMLALPAHSEVPAQGARPPAPLFGTEVAAQGARPPVTLVVPGARGRNGAPALGFPNGPRWPLPAPWTSVPALIRPCGRPMLLPAPWAWRSCSPAPRLRHSPSALPPSGTMLPPSFSLTFASP